MFRLKSTMNQNLVNKSADFLLSELNTVFRVKLSIFMREQKCGFFLAIHPFNVLSTVIF